jgi:hypothetical protein
MSNLESSGTPEPAHPGVASRIRNYFLTGLIVAGPVAITIWLVWSFVTWVDDLVRPFIPVAYRPETYLPIKVPGFGLIIAVRGPDRARLSSPPIWLDGPSSRSAR